jgi:hypothetical protein
MNLMTIKFAALSVFSAASTVLSVGVAGAEPPPPPPPPPPPALPLFPLAQAGAPAPVGGNELVLGQHAVPSAPGSGLPATAPNLNPWNNQYLLPQNVLPAAPGEGEIFGVAPGQENANISSIDYLKRLVDSYRAGGLEGALLGQNPVEGVGKPLPPVPPQQ